MNLKTRLQSYTLTEYWLGIILAVLCLGQLQRWQLSTSVAVYLHDPLILGFVAWHTARNAGGLPSLLQKVWRNAPVGVLLGGWTLVGVIVAFIQSGDSTSLLYVARLGVYLGFLATLLQLRRLTGRTVRAGVLFVGGYYLFAGTLQYLLLPDVRFLRALGWDDHYYRLISPLLDPNYTGLVFTLTLVLLLSHQVRPRWFTWSFALWLTAGIAATLSRASYLALLGALSVLSLPLSLHKQRPHLHPGAVVGLLLTLLMCLYLLPKPGGEGVNLARTASISARFAHTSQAVVNLQGVEWVIGTGLYSPVTTRTEPSAIPHHARVADNLLVLILQSTGVVGLCLSVLILKRVLWYGWRSNRGLLAASTAVLLHAQFNNVLEPFVFLFFGMTLVTLWKLRSVGNR